MHAYDGHNPQSVLTMRMSRCCAAPSVPLRFKAGLCDPAIPTPSARCPAINCPLPLWRKVRAISARGPRQRHRPLPRHSVPPTRDFAVLQRLETLPRRPNTLREDCERSAGLRRSQTSRMRHRPPCGDRAARNFASRLLRALLRPDSCSATRHPRIRGEAASRPRERCRCALIAARRERSEMAGRKEQCAHALHSIGRQRRVEIRARHPVASLFASPS